MSYDKKQTGESALVSSSTTLGRHKKQIYKII